MAGPIPLASRPSLELDLSTGPKFCIVGAGSSGLAAAKHFRALGIAFECLEREDDVGGNWYYGKPHSSVYRSTRLISSKRETEYTDFPMPYDWPEHPGHELVWQYLRNYASHFDLYPSIQFNTSISRIEPAAEAASGVNTASRAVRARVGEWESGRVGEGENPIFRRPTMSPPLPLSLSPSLRPAGT